MHYRKNQKGYVCGTYGKRGKVACSSHLVKEKDLEEAITNDLNTMLVQLNTRTSKSTKGTNIKKHVKSLKKLIQQAENKISHLSNKKSKMLGLLIDDTISKEIYNEKISALSLEIQKLSQEIKKHNKVLNKLSDTNIINEIKKISEVAKIKSLTPEILNRLIEKIEIFEGGSARIYYRFSCPSLIFSL